MLFFEIQMKLRVWCVTWQSYFPGCWPQDPTLTQDVHCDVQVPPESGRLTPTLTRTLKTGLPSFSPPQLHFQSHCGTFVSTSPCLTCTLPSSATPVLPVLPGLGLTGSPLCNLHGIASSHIAVSPPWSPDIVPLWKVSSGTSLVCIT